MSAIFNGGRPAVYSAALAAAIKTCEDAGFAVIKREQVRRCAVSGNVQLPPDDASAKDQKAHFDGVAQALAARLMAEIPKTGAIVLTRHGTPDPKIQVFKMETVLVLPENIPNQQQARPGLILPA